MENGTLKLIIFSFIMSILFPMFAYTFTTFGDSAGQFDLTYSKEEFINAGIQISDWESHNVTFGAGHQEYEVNNETMRIVWKDALPIIPDFFAHQQQSWVHKILNSWAFPVEMNLIINPSEGQISSKGMTNATVIAHYDSQYNWTRYQVVQNSLLVFISPLPASVNNITTSILNGTVTVTVAAQAFEQGSLNFWGFVNWYFGIVTGNSGTWGLPAFMVWIVRIFTFMTLLAAFLLATELLPG